MQLTKSAAISLAADFGLIIIKYKTLLTTCDTRVTITLDQKVLDVQRGDNMRYGELHILLRANGCKVVREGTRHAMWRSEVTGKTFPVPRHSQKDVPAGTLKSIKRDAGLK